LPLALGYFGTWSSALLFGHSEGFGSSIARRCSGPDVDWRGLFRQRIGGSMRVLGWSSAGLHCVLPDVELV
jgi:hypothetical protein